ncbi:MAG: hypothetical protein GQ580_01565 [Candidatus Thorarchaeota archaeon]|nr:hypothetical protein [Candidatus Thorarchaeota archaeon]
MKTVVSENLERFRRVAKYNRVTLPEAGLLTPREEIAFLQDAMNGRVYARAEKWMLPNWAILALRKADPDEVEGSGLPNNGYLNWGPIGSPGAKSFGITDTHGLVTAIPECGSIDFWPQGAEGVAFPALAEHDGPKLNLLSSQDQLYGWEMTTGPVTFSRMIYHVSEGDNEAVFNEILLTNRSLEEVNFAFYVALRPMSARGVEPIEKIEYDEAKSTLYSNGLIALIANRSPSAVVMANADNPSLVETAKDTTDRHDRDYSATKGLASAVLRYDVKLRPAGSERIFFISPLSAVKRGARDLSFTTHEGTRDISVERWFKFSGKRSAGTYPERNFDDILSQAKASLAIQAHTALLSQEPTTDWRARARIILALQQTGCYDLATELCLEVPREFDIKEGSSDSAILGPLLWGLLLPNDNNSANGYLKEISSYIENAVGVLLETMASEVEDNRAPPPEPVVEESIDVLSVETEEFEDSPSEVEGFNSVPADETPIEVETPVVEPPPPPEPWTLSELNQAIWNLAAIQKASVAFKPTWNEKVLAKIDQTITDYSELIDTKLDEMPSFSEPELTDAYSLDLLELLSAISQLRLYNLAEKFLKEVVKIISSKVISKGLVRLSEPPVHFSSYLSLWLAHYYTRKKMRDDAEELLRKSLEFLSDYNVLPEWVNPRTGGGSKGSGCSIHAAANLLLLLRDMMLYTEGNNLIVFPGIPEGWYTSKYPLIVSRIPTSIGPVHLEIGASKNQHQIEVKLESLPEEIEFRLPSAIPISIVKVYGGGVAERSDDKNFPYVKVVPLSESIVLTFRK